MAYKQPDPSEAGGKVPQPPSFRLQSIAYSEAAIRARGERDFRDRRRKLFPGGVD